MNTKTLSVELLHKMDIVRCTVKKLSFGKICFCDNSLLKQAQTLTYRSTENERTILGWSKQQCW
jgi:hypothetical protein